MVIFWASLALAGEPDEEFCHAIVRGDVAGIEAAKAAGANPEHYCTVERRVLGLGDVFVAAIPFVNIAVGLSGGLGSDKLVALSPVQLAFETGKVPVVEAVLDAGAPLPPIDDALRFAVEEKNAALLDPVLARGGSLAGAELPVVWAGVWELLPELMARGFPVDAKNLSGHTLLVKQAREGCVPCVSKLLLWGADVAAPGVLRSVVEFDDRHGEGRRAAVKALVAMGADPNATGVLFVASASGDVAMVELLLSLGASPDGTPGFRPLVAASKRGSAKMLTVLEAAGASLSVGLEEIPKEVADDWGSDNRRPVDAAVEERRLAALQWWQKRGFEPAPEQVVEAGRRDLEDLVFLETAGLLKTTTADGTTVLHWAAQSFRPEENIPWLLKRGFKADVRRVDGTTPLQLTDDLTAAKLLLARGASIDAPGPTPALHRAAGEHSAELLALYLSKKPDLELRDASGRTALAVAYLRGNREHVATLLKAGASPLRVDGERSLLTLAIEKRDTTYLKKLLAEGVTPGAADVEAAMGQKDVLRMLLEKGAPPGDRALGVAIQAGDREVVRLLLAAGADTSRVDGEGHTAIEAAVLRAFRQGTWSSDLTMLETLYEGGAGISATSADDTTPLLALLAVPADAPRFNSIEGYEEPGHAWVEWLLARGASVRERGPSGETAVEVAISARRYRALSLLADRGAPLPKRVTVERADAVLLADELLNRGVEVDWKPGLEGLCRQAGYDMEGPNAAWRVLSGLSKPGVPLGPIEQAVVANQPLALFAMLERRGLNSEEFKRLKSLAKEKGTWKDVKWALKKYRQ